MSQLRAIALPVLAPTLAFSVGEGAMIPIIPAVAAAAGADLATAGLIAAMIPLGCLLGDIPSGWVVARIGERASMIGAALISLLGLGIAVTASTPAMLGIGVLLIGLSAAVFNLARHAFMTTAVPFAFRARALAMLGGAHRLGLLVGPFIAALVIQLTGSTQAVFWVHLAGCIATVAILLLLPDPARSFAHSVNGRARRADSGERGADSLTEGATFVRDEASGLFSTIWRSRRVLATLGAGAALVGALRASRNVMIPLWAVSIGVPDATTAIVIGIAGTLDFSLFYASGQVMDRWGRSWTAVPAMLGLGLTHLALAFTHELDNRFTWLVAIAMVMALANGIGSGILMTLGADLADPRNPAPFLGAWRFTSDAGGAAAPLIVAAVTAGISIASAAALMGLLGVVGAGVLARYIPRFPPRRFPVGQAR